MIQMNIAEAKAKLSELVARAEAGETVILARDGKPAATITPLRGKRVLGRYANGEPLQDPDRFIGPDPEMAATVDDDWRPREPE